MTEPPEDLERLRARLRELDELAARPATPVAEARYRRDEHSAVRRRDPRVRDLAIG